MTPALNSQWRGLLAEYLEAERCHDETQRIMDRAQRLAWRHLAKRVGDERAFELAGIALVRAWRDLEDRFIFRGSDREAAYWDDFVLSFPSDEALAMAIQSLCITGR